MDISKDRWTTAMHRAAVALSRSAQGTATSAYGGAKPAAAIEDPGRLQDRAGENLRLAIDYAWRMSSHKKILRSHMNIFGQNLALLVSDGLLQPGQSIFRTWNTSYAQQVPHTEIWGAYMESCLEISNRLAAPDCDHIALAAWTERELDWRIHPWADGCGRTTKIMGACILRQAGLLPAQFSVLSEYYAHMPDAEQWERYYRLHVAIAP